jgi:dTDP-glucose 4,6-dehydratase
MHFAASTHVDNSFGASLEFTKNNILGTHILLECAHKKNCIRRFMHVSTDEVYGEGMRQESFSEHDSLEPTNPYSATKAGAEYLVKAYSRSFGLPVIITRGNNVYGPRQFPEKLIPKFICRLQRNMKLCLHGNGQNRRSFIYVEDVARAFDVVLHQGVIGETYNIGVHGEMPNIEVASELIRLLKGDHVDPNSLLEFVADRPFNDMRYPLDLSKRWTCPSCTPSAGSRRSPSPRVCAAPSSGTPTTRATGTTWRARSCRTRASTTTSRPRPASCKGGVGTHPLLSLSSSRALLRPPTHLSPVSGTGAHQRRNVSCLKAASAVAACGVAAARDHPSVLCLSLPFVVVCVYSCGL